MYAELHAASAFSFLEGASLPEDLVGRAQELGYEAVALCDRDGVSGAPRFYQAAKAAGLHPIIGCEISMESERRLTVLVENRLGYQNLCRLLTRMHLSGPKGQGRARWDDVETYAGGLVALIDDIRDGDRILSIFKPQNAYVELQRHFRDQQEAANQARLDFAGHHRLPLLAVNGVRYARQSSRQLFDALTCIRHKTTLDLAGRLLESNAERHLKSPVEMTRLFRDVPEAVQNSAELSRRLQFTLHDLGYQFPRYPLPPGEIATSYLRQITLQGAAERYRDKAHQKRAYRQIAHELNVIQKLQLEGYFLIVWDITQFAKRNNILCQGRGSAANSAVCYALGITAVDSVEMELLFERFLSEERGEWPDIDIDFPSGEKREMAIQYVYERYGKYGAAMTATVISYRDKSAVREIAKTLSFSEESIERLSKCIHYMDATDDGRHTGEQIRMAGFDPTQSRFQHLARLTHEIKNLPRHLSQHPGGMVICQGELDSVVPLENARMPDRRIVQWDKEDCADLGIVKVDLLGLGMLNALEECITIINSRGADFDIAHVPPNDEKTYQMIQAADTVGSFQIESRAQMATLPRMKPACFYDLVVQVAIIRPGPIAGDMAHPFLRRRLGREAVTYPHPSLIPVLKRTLGVPLFQEQLLRMVMIAASFTGGEAEELRRAIGFKRSVERMKLIEGKLRRGLHANGIQGEGQEKIVKAVTSFALFGFPESHSASFALIAYSSSYLKAHYPAAFYVSLLNAQPMGFYSPATLVQDAQRHGIRVKPIDVAVSDLRCRVETDERIRIGLNYVSGITTASAVRIVTQRAVRRFRSIDDFTRRTQLRKSELETLAKIGALNSLGEDVHRRDALWQVEKAWRSRGPLFQNLEEPHEPSPLNPMTPTERLDADYRGAGLTTGPHPLYYQRAQLNELGVVAAARLHALDNGRPVRVAGMVITRQRPMTAKGFVFLSLEDETGVSNVVVRPPMFQKHRSLWTSEPALLIDGVIQKQDGVIHIRAEDAMPLEMHNIAPASHDFH
ncbi:MAG: error-prone DNA polymerase [Acidobacteria bacterium]|nr:error-prone DNA polymerase [Acidobacteriota bacterium]MDA1234787.1 error-prone DNA polymerase [Acidobacteriota bacterium]